MSKLKQFVECVDEYIDEDDRISIKCKLGLWSVSSKDSDSVYLEAFHYWRQYADDGEYHSIIGGKTQLEALKESCNG
jgi:hypothetical protein